MPDDFDVQKEKQLSQIDKSRKGFVDEEIKFLVDKLNSMNDYYTTSSCAGRIVLLARKSDKKCDAEWIYVSHKEAVFEDVKKALSALPKSPVWFKQESAILHVCCRTFEAAQRLLDTCKLIGFKRSGINSTRKRVIVEVASTEQMDTIIADEGEMLINDAYLKVLIREGNRRMERNRKRMKGFYEKLNML